MAVITAREWRWVATWTIVILLLSGLPYLLAIGMTPSGWQFVGLLVNPLDGHSYLAKMRQGMEGNWLFHLTYTPEPHEGAFIFIFYLALGHLAALLHLPPIWIFHLARLATGLVLLLVAYRFVARVTPNLPERRLAFVLLFSAAGLGWLGPFLGAFPIDLWVPEAFVPYSLYANPHFPLAMALMLLIFQAVTWPTGRLTSSLLGVGLAALGLALILPFALLTTWAVLAVFLGWLALARCPVRPHLGPALSAVVVAAPVVFYDYWVSTTNPVLAGWGAQNLTPAPRPLDMVLGYGLVGLLAVLGGVRLLRRGWRNLEVGEGLILVWTVTTLLLVYFPFELQRRLITGLHLPLCLLAALGLQRWLAGSRLRLSRRRSLTSMVVALSAMGTLFVWGLPLLAIRQSPATSEATALLFLRDEEVAAFAWLRQHARPGDVILASPRLGAFVPGQSGARAFYGHPFETLNAASRRHTAEAFYRGDLAKVPDPVDFVIYGPSEQAIGRPVRLDELPALFTAANLTIYAAGNP